MAATSLTGASVGVTLLDASGTPLALGTAGATNVSQTISDFVAPADGNYYALVTGQPGTNYSLVVTRQRL